MSTTSMDDGKPYLKIVFDGVVTVGPGQPEKGDHQEGPFFAVMPRSTRRLSDRTQRLARARAAGIGKSSRSEIETEETPFYIPMHVPTVFTRLKPADDSRPPDQVLQLSPFHERWYLWHPIRERLEFRIDGDGTAGPLEYPRGGPLAFSGRGHYLQEGELSFRGIEHVPDLRQIWPERSVLLDGLLSADPGVSEKVATQVLVPRGMVVAAGVLEAGAPRAAVFEPVRGRDKHDALLPNAAVVVEATKVEIASYSLDTGDRLDSIRFDIPEGGEIWLSNGDPSDVELDMERLSMQIAERTIKQQGWKPPADALPSFALIAERLGRNVDDVDLSALIFQVHHHGRDRVLQGLAREHHRHHPRNIDLDFELFYTLMKNERLTGDGGLPVPRRPGDQDTGGPDCYICVSGTNDRVFLKSQSR